MMNLIKSMRNKKTSHDVLKLTKVIADIKKSESLKSALSLDNDYDAYDKLERIGYKIAIKQATTPEEFEECAVAVAVEENYYGDLDPQNWAEQIRIRAYGIEWYMKKQLNTPAYVEFKAFLDDVQKIGA